MITINSISFSNSLRPSQPTTNYLLGNAGDVIVATINLTTTQALNDFYFYVNSIPNEQQIYSDALSTEIFDSAFNSLTNNLSKFYVRSGSSINTTNKTADNTLSIVVNDLGGLDYEIVHTFVLAPILREDDLVNETFETPSYYQTTGLKYVLKIESFNGGDVLEDTNGVNLEESGVIKNGRVGGWGSALGIGAINYTTTINPVIDNININSDITLSAQIKKESGNWLVSDIISYRIQRIQPTTDFNPSLTLLENTKYDYVTHNVEDAPQNGTNNYLLNCSSQINASDNTLLDLTFTIASQYASEFALFFAASDDLANLNHQNTLPTFGTASLQADDSQVEFTNYAGFQNNAKIGFINWYNQTFVYEGFNHLRAYRKDDNEVFFGVKINQPVANLPPERQTAGLSNALRGGVTNIATVTLTDINTPFPFTINLGDSIAIQYFRNGWFTDIVVVDTLVENNTLLIGFEGTPKFSGIPNSNAIGTPIFARLRNITIDSATIEIGQQTPNTGFPDNSNFPSDGSGSQSGGTLQQDVGVIKLDCGFKDLDTGVYLSNERFDFDFSTELPFTLDRGYIRKDDNPKKYIQVAFVGDRYQFRYGFNVGAEFLESSNIVFEANVNFTDINGFAVRNTIRSPKLEIGQYDTTQNTVAEPQVLPVEPLQTKFYIVDDTNTPNFLNEFDSIVAGQNMLVETTFEDNNLNDLQANEADLAGYFALTVPSEIKEQERYFFSTYESEPTTPFESINGYTAGLVKVTKIDIKTVKISAIINYDRLKAAFPNDNNICVVSRIDRLQPESNPFYRELHFHFTQPNGTQLITNAVSDNLIQQKWFSDGNTINSDFRFKINPTGVTDLNDASWNLIPYLSVAQFESESILTGYTIRVEYIGLGTQTDILGKVEYISLIPTVSPFVGTHTRLAQTASNDFMAFYTEDLTLTEFTATNTNRLHNVRTDSELLASSDLTVFDSYNITNLNANLAGSIQKYAHFFLEPTTLNDTITTVKGNFGSANREVIEYVTGSKRLGYPVIGNGTNPPAINFDRTNDRALAIDANVTSFMNIWTMAPGERRTVVIRSRNLGANNIAFEVGRGGISGDNSGGLFGDRIGYGQTSFVRFEAYLPIISDLGVKTIVWHIERPPAFDGSPITDYISAWINGRKVRDIEFINTLNNLNQDTCNSNLIGVTASAISAPSASPLATEYVAFFNGFLNEEEIRRISVGGKNEVFNLSPRYAWDFSQIVNTNEVPHVGVLSAPNLALVNHTNIVGNLF